MIRSRQRFENFERAFRFLEKCVLLKNPDDIARSGMIQAFEMCFELSWNLLKDYLESEGYEVKTPRQAIKQAYQSDLIEDGHTWIDALDNRNLTAHIYNEPTAERIAGLIKTKYFPLMEKLYTSMKKSLLEK